MKQALYFNNKDGFLMPVLVEYRIIDDYFYAGINGIENNLLLVKVRESETNTDFFRFDIAGNFQALKKIAISEIEKTGGKLKRIDLKKSPTDTLDLEQRMRFFCKSKAVGEPYHLFDKPTFDIGYWRNFKKEIRSNKLSLKNCLYVDSELKRIYGNEFYFKSTDFLKTKNKIYYEKV